MQKNLKRYVFSIVCIFILSHICIAQGGIKLSDR